MSDCEHEWKDCSVHESPARLRETCIKCGAMRVGQLLSSLKAEPGSIVYVPQLLGWKTEKPTKKGFYWYRTHDRDIEPIVVMVEADGTVDMPGCSESLYISRQPWMSDDRWSDELRKFPCEEGQWFGPLEPPV